MLRKVALRPPQGRSLWGWLLPEEIAHILQYPFKDQCITSPFESQLILSGFISSAKVYSLFYLLYSFLNYYYNLLFFRLFLPWKFWVSLVLLFILMDKVMESEELDRSLIIRELLLFLLHSEHNDYLP